MLRLCLQLFGILQMSFFVYVKLGFELRVSCKAGAVLLEPTSSLQMSLILFRFQILSS
jgi:hypothetical protein